MLHDIASTRTENTTQKYISNLAKVLDNSTASYEITPDQWVISIARKPKGSNPEHAFLIVEGMMPSGQAVIRRYDLVMDNANSKQAKIAIHEWYGTTEAIADILWYDCLKEQEVYTQSWDITKQQASQLDQSAKNDQQSPPFYQVSGNVALFPKLASQEEGHSCFSWAREKLLELGDKRMRKIEPDIFDFIAAQTSRYIKNPLNEDDQCTSGGKCLVM